MTNQKPDFAAMTNPQLVAIFNEMVTTAIDLGLEGVKPVNRFADAKAGAARCEKLHSSIQARIASNKAAEGPEVGHEVTQSEVQETSATTEGNTAPDNQTEEDERLPGETDEEHMARKAKAKKKAPAKKAAAKKAPGKPRVKDGTSIREMTDEYNAIVAKMTKAQKEAAPFAKHHTSLFESKDKAKIQLKKLKDAIAKA